jgi:hypothetical protein
MLGVGVHKKGKFFSGKKKCDAYLRKKRQFLPIMYRWIIFHRLKDGA